ncbi:MAG TPA: hypothetical protein VKX28_21095 [Xanthobacteraceae bacterium]|nr:hypothetical protein [Xanthobacteraceae bacterium]
MIESSAKVLVGTVLYVAVLWAARRNPRAAGMMLTFPTLNGITMLVTQPSELSPIVGTMLLIPFLNGLFCALYLSGFDRAVRAGFSPRAASGLLIACVAVVWLTTGWVISQNRWNVPADDRNAYALVLMLGGLLLTWLLPVRRAKASQDAPPVRLGHLLDRNRIRIGLFAIALAAVLIVDKIAHSPAVVGLLSALPLIAFFSLHTLASDPEQAPSARREELATMANGVWFGPAVAVVFIVCFWRWLALLATRVEGAGYLAVGVPSLLIGWSLCLAAIWLCERLLRRAASPAA